MIKKSTKPQVSPKWNPSCVVLTLGDGYGSKGLCSAATALGPAWRERTLQRPQLFCIFLPPFQSLLCTPYKLLNVLMFHLSLLSEN